MVRYGQMKVNILARGNIYMTHRHGHPACDNIMQVRTENLLAKVTRELISEGAKHSLQAVGRQIWGEQTDQHTLHAYVHRG